MKLLSSMAIAFSMYSRIPMPRQEWTKERMEYAMCFFPLVGVVIGMLDMIFLWLGQAVNLSVTAAACLGTILPVIVTGGIHMDGFADTVDALSSYQPIEKRLEILKDPHTGAFAIIGIATYLLAFSGLLGELYAWEQGRLFVVYAGVPVMSRAFSGLSVVLFPKAKKSGLAFLFSDSAGKGGVVVSMTVFSGLAFGWFWMAGNLVTAGVLGLVGFGGWAYYYWMSKKKFGGITGDIAGYFLQIEELLLLAVLVVMGKAGMV